jgi:hypothetical protein
VLLFPGFAGLHVLLFRARKPDSPGYAQLGPALAAYGLVWLIASVALGLTSAGALVAGACLIGFLGLAYMQVFSLTVRGFSLRIMGDIAEHGPRTFEEIIRGYSGGRGLDWMFEKRVAALESLGILRREGECMTLQGPLGVWAARLGVWTKRFLKMGAGG